ncbi:unnamed protein product, partial [Prorocentrum cordatum]
FIHPQRAAAASSQGPATGSPNARTAFGGGGGGGGGQGEEVWDRQPAPLSVGMQMALMTRELLSGLGAHRIPGKLHIAAECYCLDWTRTEFRGSCTHRRMSKRSRVQDLLKREEDEEDDDKDTQLHNYKAMRPCRRSSSCKGTRYCD